MSHPLIVQNHNWAPTFAPGDTPDFFKTLASNPQEPHTLWIGCSDSRVPESVITNSEPGQIFVHRNIANQYRSEDVNSSAVLSYAVGHLHVKHVVVVGHTECGGAKTSLAAVVNNPNINIKETIVTIPPTGHGHGGSNESLNTWLEPLTRLLFTEGVHLKGEKNRLLEAVKVNVKKQVENVVNSEPIQSAWKQKQDVDVHGWLYHLDTGKLEDLKCSHRPPQNWLSEYVGGVFDLPS